MQSSESIEQLLKSHGTDVLRFVRFYTRNRQDAEDLTQEVFLRAFQGRATFREECSSKTWLLKIAVNVCRNYHRTLSRHPQDPVADLPCLEVSPSAESEVLQRVEDIELMTLVSKLPIHLKEVVVLYYFEEKPVKDIAQVLNISSSTVKIRLFRARQSLKHGKEHLQREEQSASAGFLKQAEVSS